MASALLATYFIMLSTTSADSQPATTPARSGMVASDRIRASMWGLYAGDALAMPAHWFYSRPQLRKVYGVLETYVKPVDRLPGSILGKSNLFGGGRTSYTRKNARQPVVGRVILKGKERYWKEPDWFYHRGMAAGENTLEGTLTRLISRSLTEKKTFDKQSIFEGYVELMTTKDAHNDTYAATAHRMFFNNLDRGKPFGKCADNDGHNTDAADGLVNCVPCILSVGADRAAARKASTEMVSMFRRSRTLPSYAVMYSDLLYDIVYGPASSRESKTDSEASTQPTCAEKKPAERLRDAVVRCATRMGYDVKMDVEKDVAYEAKKGRGVADPMTACYVNSNFPAMLYFAYKYAEDPQEALLANANAGGECVARGALLGAVVGAAHGMEGWKRKKRSKLDIIGGLTESEKIAREIDAFVDVIPLKTSAM